MNAIFRLTILLVFLNPFKSEAQIIPGAPQTSPILILGGTAHIGNGEVIKNAAISFDNGKITAVSKVETDALDKEKFQIIDAAGKHIYPGFIAMNTQLGLVDIQAVRATKDFREVGQMNPHVRALIAYNTDSKILPTVRSNGVLLAQVCPQGNTISGQSSLMALDGWNWEDAVMESDQGIHMNWPRLYQRPWRRSEKEGLLKNKKYHELVSNIERFFEEAKAYASDNPIERDQRMESMRGLFDQSKRLYVHVNAAKSIEAAVLFGKRLGVSVAIVGGRDAWQITDLLKSNSIPVVLFPTQSLPGHKDEPIDQPYKTAEQLYSAGITVAISRGLSWQNFNVPFHAGQAAAFGLDKEAAIQCITLNPARIMGVDDRLGTIEAGKEATLIISNGDALDMIGNDLIHAWIQGREVNLDNHHKIMARKYESKYK